MPVAETIKPIKVDGEFRTCTVCGYDMGFHVSFQKGAGDTTRIVLICPECGARFDVNWDVTLSDS